MTVIAPRESSFKSGERRQSWVACWTDGPRVLPREEVRECDGNPMEDVEDSGERKKASWTNDRRDRNRTMNTETGNYLCLADGRVGRPHLSPTQPHVGLLLSVLAVGGRVDVEASRSLGGMTKMR